MESQSPIPHEPVLMAEVLDQLNLAPGMTVLDATLGAGGHSEAILERISPNGVLIGADRDEEILDFARRRLSRFGDRVRIYRSSFFELSEVFRQEGIERLDAWLMDLGVSSLQLDEAARGFSFQQDGPLDMRMGASEQTMTAAEIVNQTPEKDLADLIFRYGEERRSRRIAKEIVQQRRKKKFERTLELATLIERAVGRTEKIHPATRTFLALRLAVNQELEQLSAGLELLSSRLRVGGRGAVISFHSLEDRVVKEFFRGLVRAETCRLVLKKPAVASEAERIRNRRSRSAKLRVVEKIA